MEDKRGDILHGGNMIERPSGDAAAYSGSNWDASGCLLEGRFGATAWRRVKDSGPLLAR